MKCLSMFSFTIYFFLYSRHFLNRRLPCRPLCPIVAFLGWHPHCRRSPLVVFTLVLSRLWANTSLGQIFLVSWLQDWWVFLTSADCPEEPVNPTVGRNLPLRASLPQWLFTGHCSTQTMTLTKLPKVKETYTRSQREHIIETIHFQK